MLPQEYKQQLTKALNKSVVLVKFKKANGTIRDMKCTLLAEHISTVSFSNARPETDLVTVWDIEKDAWRSFNINSVLGYGEVV